MSVAPWDFIMRAANLGVRETVEDVSLRIHLAPRGAPV